MAVIRISKTKGFTVMSNYHLRDQNLSLKAKGLLSMMLSLPDEWHYSIRGLTAICKEGVSSISATIRELEDCGYVRRHQPIVDGKFQEIEYIIYENPQPKTADKDTSANADSGSTDSADQTASRPQCGTAYSDNAHTEKPCTENPHTGNPYTETPDAQNSHAYKITNQTRTERTRTEENNHPSINHAAAPANMMDGMDGIDSELMKRLGAIRLSGDFERYRKIVKENIDFDSLCYDHDRETLEGIVEIMVEVLCSNAPYTRIGSQDFPTEVVKSRLMKLDSQHIQYVLTALSMNTTKIHNLKAYLLTTLYNAYTTMSPFYDNWVRSDYPELARPR